MKTLTGKTYSLFGDADSTEEYYSVVRKLIDNLLKKYPDENKLLFQIRKVNKKFSIINKLYRDSQNQISLENIKSELFKYTYRVKEHLNNITFFQRFDSTINTTENQYYFYMLEIELVNRIYKDAFKNSQYKMALLPHCLRDFQPKCLSIAGDIEQICKGCTKDCYIHLGSKILKRHSIDPYISVTIDQVSMFKKLKTKHKSMAALGIACIPELARGMRMCLNFGIPAIGIPLDANRCARWMGKAYETSFNLDELEKLVN